MARTADFLTVLATESGAPAAKLITQNQDGALEIDKIPRSFLHDVEEVEVFDLQSLGGALEQLERQPWKYVIRGQLISGRPRTGVRRLLKPQQDSPATFEAHPRRWCMVDIDELPLPLDVSDFKGNKARLVEVAVAHLPPEFAGVDCWCQFSASMGVKTDRIRLHLWFWLDRPVNEGELKAWLQGFQVDRAVFSPVQPHYTAAPLLADGVGDPMPNRSGFYPCKATGHCRGRPRGIRAGLARRHWQCAAAGLQYRQD